MPDILSPVPEIHPPLKFPYCLVWTHIPVISWLLPMIGHVGICDSSGTIYDFTGSQRIDSGKLAFGNTLKWDTLIRVTIVFLTAEWSFPSALHERNMFLACLHETGLNENLCEKRTLPVSTWECLTHDVSPDNETVYSARKKFKKLESLRFHHSIHSMCSRIRLPIALACIVTDHYKDTCYNWIQIAEKNLHMGKRLYSEWAAGMSMHLCAICGKIFPLVVIRHTSSLQFS